MRRYYIVSAVLLILPIIDFAVAVPVLVQDKRPAGVYVGHIPEDPIIMLRKRGGEEVEKLLGEYFNNMGKPVESSDAHALSSSAPPGPNHGSTNVVQAPAPGPASSTANPDPLMEPSGPSSSVPKQGDDKLHGPLYTSTSTESGLDHELTGGHAAQPNPKKRPLTDPDLDLDGNYWQNYEDPQPPKKSGQAHENQVEHVEQPNPGPSTDSDGLRVGPSPYRLGLRLEVMGALED